MRALRFAAVLLLSLPATASAAAFTGPSVGPIPVEFIIFALVLAGVGLFHHHTFKIGVTGATVLAIYKILFSPFVAGAAVCGFISYL